jgi:subtilisin-like proprotein convertase family protein
MIRNLFFAGILLFCSAGGKAQTFSGTGGNVPDYPGTAAYSISVSGLTPSTLDTTSFGLEKVCINFNHTWDADMEITLISPNGTATILTSGNGGSGDNYNNTCFDDVSPTPISSGSAPFTGNFLPTEDLGYHNNGQNGNGTWQLFFRDMWSQDSGYLFNWSITFGNNPAKPFRLSSSNLPIVVINTYNQNIPNEPKIYCHMGIIYNGQNNRNYMTDPFNEYNGRIGIELRGASSQSFPQKSYGLTLVDTNNLEVDSGLVGMPKEHDWILYAPYDDKTCIRNILTYKLTREMDHYAPRTKLCELVVNGKYEGVYVIMEKIKRDKKRVDIKKLDSTEVTWPGISGGYLLKVDWINGNGGGGWTSNYPPMVNPNGQTIYIQYAYPKDVNILPQQASYIHAYVDSFETALAGPNFQNLSTGFRKYTDVTTWIDYFLMNELSKNVDGYRISSYLYKDSVNGMHSGGKLAAGPLWDFNLAWWNADYCQGNNVNGWAYQFGTSCPGDGAQIPFWWDRMLQDSIYARDLKCRWQTWRQSVLDTTHIMYLIDSLATFLNESQQRHFARWPILGVYTWPNPSPLATNYAGEIANLKTWVRDRMSWMDANLPGNCWNAGVGEVNSLETSFNVYPNPFNDELHVDFYLDTDKKLKMELCDELGRVVKQIDRQEFASGGNKLVLQLTQDVPAGLYFLKVTSENGMFAMRVVRMK